MAAPKPKSSPASTKPKIVTKTTDRTSNKANKKNSKNTIVKALAKKNKPDGITTKKNAANAPAKKTHTSKRSSKETSPTARKTSNNNAAEVLHKAAAKPAKPPVAKKTAIVATKKTRSPVASAQNRVSRKLLLFAGIVIFFGVVSAAIVQNRSGRVQQNSYSEATATWLRENLRPVQKLVRGSMFSDVTLANPSAASDNEVSAITGRCDTIKSTQNALSKLVVPPVTKATLSSSGVSADSVQKQKNDLQAALNNYRRSANGALNELISYCNFTTKNVTMSTNHIADEATLQASKVKKGVTSTVTNTDGSTTTTSCNFNDGCIPTEPSAVRTYLAAYKIARLDSAQSLYALYGGENDSCPLTDLRPICTAYNTSKQPIITSIQAFMDAVTSSANTANDPAITAADAVIASDSSRASSAILAAYKKTFPAVDTAVADYAYANEISLLKKYETQLAKLSFKK